jgi:hypothetical protein
MPFVKAFHVEGILQFLFRERYCFTKEDEADYRRHIASKE